MAFLSVDTVVTRAAGCRARGAGYAHIYGPSSAPGWIWLSTHGWTSLEPVPRTVPSAQPMTAGGLRPSRPGGDRDGMNGPWRWRGRPVGEGGRSSVSNGVMGARGYQPRGRPLRIGGTDREPR